ncbi:exopolysaccharide biosynthesis polyprenyl glycosylphosphotransferase [Ruminococcus sp. XPD3002]|uniref:exopolysaccharide biosynthesis polyprenyl glycosylphosphotransferase n=1 Tax=Ruminococcus sp. XPD3002 TaxID=1452269 RepID=UPI000921E3B4|nr:exopolysaccharide biosynthesis polyprenyl glycosylphosphotransferase [Ruminococcus flavefaciens]
MGEAERKRRQRRFDEVKSSIRRVEAIIEVIVLALTYYGVWRIKYDGSSMPPFFDNGKYLLTLVYVFLNYILFFYCDGFKFGHIKLTDVTISQWISMFILNFVTYFQLCLIANQMITPIPMLILMGIDILLTFGLSYLFTAIYHSFCIPKRMIMIYGKDDAPSLKQKMETRSDKYQIKRMMSCDEFSLEAIESAIMGYDAVVINDVDAQTRNDLLKFCYQNSIRTYSVPNLSDVIYSGSEDIMLFDTPLKLVRGRGLTPAQRFAKRAMDLTLCLIAMIPSSLIMLIIAIAIKLEDGGSVFYRQRRITKGGKQFDILKFRSMIENAEADGKPHPATDNDDRITKVGKVIRTLRVDELPQLFNIIKGDMSIVGPRPERVEHCEMYGAKIPEFEFRNKVKGGLTGYAQVYGKYNTTALDKLKLDLMYIENYSLALDLRIILMTVRILFKKESTEGFDVTNNVEISNKAEYKEKQLVGK